jgi:hypothetical protein
LSFVAGDLSGWPSPEGQAVASLSSRSWEGPTWCRIEFLDVHLR